MKTAELDGSLDLWVAWALDWHQEGGFWYGPTDLTGRVTRDDNPIQEEVTRFHPSRFWAQGGPIIEREKIELSYIDHECWYARVNPNAVEPYGLQHQEGRTPLIAAMRAFVYAKYGDVVPG